MSCDLEVTNERERCWEEISSFILLHEKLLHFDWLRVVVFQLNLKYPHVKITAGSSINK